MSYLLKLKQLIIKIKLFKKNFKNIIYVSCSTETYIRDINLIRSHKITNIELFDQFPNKNHLEIVSVLKMIE